MKKSASKRSIEDWEPASVPEAASLTILREAAAECTACPLYKRATQTVFGEGRENATLMLLGEQPGELEDLSGKPFVGPAGQILNHALEEAGIDRNSVYVTNPVKHFKWDRVGNGASTKNQARAISPLAVPGWKRNCASLGPACSFASARPRRVRFWLIFSRHTRAGQAA